MGLWRLFRRGLVAGALSGGLLAAASAQGLSWSTFTDPNENAFSMEFPQGWAVAGGVFHRNIIWPSPVLRVLAPDRRTLIAIGDPDAVPYYDAPIAARDYLRRFTENTIGRACPGMQVVALVDRPDYVQAALAKPFGSNYQWSAAQAFFKCSGGMAGRSAVVMQYQPPVRSGHPQYLAGFVTNSGQEDAAEQLLQHMIASKRENPEWVRRYAEIAHRLNDSVMARWQAERRQFQEMDDAITNTAHFVGPDHQRYDLNATPHYQWLGPNGQTVGTDTPTPPRPGWILLQRLPE
jgi:hypothetical protein